jgi:hypothetical protein
MKGVTFGIAVAVHFEAFGLFAVARRDFFVV